MKMLKAATTKIAGIAAWRGGFLFFWCPCFYYFYYVSHRLWLGVRCPTRLCSFLFILRLTPAVYQTADGDNMFLLYICLFAAGCLSDSRRRCASSPPCCEKLCLFYFILFCVLVAADYLSPLPDGRGRLYLYMYGRLFIVLSFVFSSLIFNKYCV